MHFEMDCTVCHDGRLQGTLSWPGHPPVPFSGTLDLLRLIQDTAAEWPDVPPA